jgi:hypothetical protein
MIALIYAAGGLAGSVATYYAIKHGGESDSCLSLVFWSLATMALAVIPVVGFVGFLTEATP